LFNTYPVRLSDVS